MESNSDRHLSQRKKNILVLLWSSAIASGRDFLAGFASEARQRKNWQLCLRMAKDVSETALLKTASRGGFDGIVTNEDTYLDFPDLAKSPTTSVVVFGTYDPEAPANVVFVQNDNAAIGRFAAQHLLSLGNFRSFGFVPTEVPHPWSDIRAKAFCDELEKKHKQAQVFDFGGKSAPLKAWLAKLPKPAAILAACDNAAISVLENCKRAKLAVPEQVSVLGVDNDELLCEFDTPTLSSISPRHQKTGELAAQTLAKMFRGWPENRPRRVVCGLQDIVERESTAALAPATHLIATALDFIRKNATRPLRVDDVVKHLGVSRSLVDLRFREFQGETVNETILRLRLEAVKQRLLSTQMSVGKVAKACGFTDIPHLQVVFKKRFGLPMGQWRQRQSERDPR